MGFVKIFWKNNVQDAYLPKTGISGQIVSEILAQLCSDTICLEFDPFTFLWRHTLKLYWE